MAEKQKRIERRHWRELKSLLKRREKLAEELQEWKEKVCDRDDVNCYPDQLREFSGQIIRDDVRYTESGLVKSGTIDRLPKDLLPKAYEFRKGMREVVEKMERKLDGYADIYDTFPDLIDIATGKLTGHDTASAQADEPKEE